MLARCAYEPRTPSLMLSRVFAPMVKQERDSPIANLLGPNSAQEDIKPCIRSIRNNLTDRADFEL